MNCSAIHHKFSTSEHLPTAFSGWGAQRVENTVAFNTAFLYLISLRAMKYVGASTKESGVYCLAKIAL